MAGPVVGATCGLVIHCSAAHLRVADLPTWTGSQLLDWALIGTLAGVVFVAGLHGFAWVVGPDQPPGHRAGS